MKTTTTVALISLVVMAALSGCARAPMVGASLPMMTGAYATPTATVAAARPTAVSAAEATLALSILKQNLVAVAKDAEDRVQGTPTVTATANPQVVTVSGTYYFNDLWGGDGTARFVATVDLQTKTVTTFTQQ